MGCRDKPGGARSTPRRGSGPLQLHVAGRQVKGPARGAGTAGRAVAGGGRKEGSARPPRFRVGHPTSDSAWRAGAERPLAEKPEKEP